MTGESSQRDRMMAALSAAEHLLSRAPFEPDAIRVRSGGSSFPAEAVGVELHFRHDPAGLRSFAKAMGVTAHTIKGEFGGEHYIEHAAVGALADVPYLAWTRTPVIPAPRPVTP